MPPVKASQASYDLVKRFESLRLNPYPCPAGLPTCGYGHTGGIRLTDKPCTEDQAEAWLREDMEEAERLVAERFRPSLKRPVLTQGEFDALCSFVFNVGGQKFKETQCTLLRWTNAGEPPEQIAEQFDRWVYARDPKTGRAVKLAGLVERRAAEKALFLSE